MLDADTEGSGAGLRRHEIRDAIARQRFACRAHGRLIDRNQARVLADEAVRQRRVDDVGAHDARVATAPLDVQQLADARSRPQRGDTLGLCRLVERHLCPPCASHRVAADVQPVARTESAQRPCPDGDRLAEIQVRDDRRIRIDLHPAGPGQLDVGHLRALELPEQRAHLLVHLVQHADERIGTAASLGGLAHEQAVRRGTNPHRKQARTTETVCSIIENIWSS